MTDNLPETIESKVHTYSVEDINLVLSSTGDPNKVHKAHEMANWVHERKISTNKVYKKYPLVPGNQMEFMITNLILEKIQKKMPGVVALDEIFTTFKGYLCPNETFFITAHRNQDDPDCNGRIAYVAELKRKKDDKTEETILCSKVYLTDLDSNNVLSLDYDDKDVREYTIYRERLSEFTDGIHSNRKDIEGLIIATASKIIARAAFQNADLGKLGSPEYFPIYRSHRIQCGWNAYVREQMKMGELVDYFGAVYINMKVEVSGRKVPQYNIQVAGFKETAPHFKTVPKDNFMPIYIFESNIALLPSEKVLNALKDLPPSNQD